MVELSRFDLGHVKYNVVAVLEIITLEYVETGEAMMKIV